MRVDEAIEVVRSHVALCGLPWGRVVRAVAVRPWWYFRVLGYRVVIDTGRGPVYASVAKGEGWVTSCAFEPTSPTDVLLPPWLTCPPYVSRVSIWWKMGWGEHYMDRWRDWYVRLSAESKRAYQSQYPESTRDGWECFYEIHDRIPERVPTPTEPGSESGADRREDGS